MKYRAAPEIISNLRTVDGEGEDTYHGDRILAVEVKQDNDVNSDGTVELDIRDFKRGQNLIVKLDLLDLQEALALATLNATRET